MYVRSGILLLCAPGLVRAARLREDLWLYRGLEEFGMCMDGPKSALKHWSSS